MSNKENEQKTENLDVPMIEKENDETKEELALKEVKEGEESKEKLSEKRPIEGITAILIDKLFAFLRKGYFSSFFEKNEKWLTKTGLLGLYAVALLGLAVSIILPLKYKNIEFECIWYGVAWSFLCIIIHYFSWKFLPVLSHIVKTTPTKLSSTAFLDSLALITGISGVASIAGGVFLWISYSSFESFVAGVFIFIFCEYIMSLCLNPKNLNVEITKQASVGEEFLGLISFFMKSSLKLIPIIFGSGIIFGAINLIDVPFMKVEYIHQITEEAIMIAQSIITVALLPVIGYFVFLIYYFLIDLAMAVLSIPAKSSANKSATEDN